MPDVWHNRSFEVRREGPGLEEMQQGVVQEWRMQQLMISDDTDGVRNFVHERLPCIVALELYKKISIGR